MRAGSCCSKLDERLFLHSCLWRRFWRPGDRCMSWLGTGSPVSTPRGVTWGQCGWASHQQQKQGKSSPSELAAFFHPLICTKTGCLHSGPLPTPGEATWETSEQLWELLVLLFPVSFLFHSFALLLSWRPELSVFFFFPLGNELR